MERGSTEYINRTIDAFEPFPRMNGPEKMMLAGGGATVAGLAPAILVGMSHCESVFEQIFPQPVTHALIEPGTHVSPEMVMDGVPLTFGGEIALLAALAWSVMRRRNQPIRSI